MRTKQAGVTLIELIIAVVIVSILASIAVPSYRDHVKRSNRTDAMAALLKLAADQEKYYMQNSSYGTYEQLDSPHTENGWYTLAVTAADADGFTATATVKSTGPQAKDTECKVFQIDSAGRRTARDGENELNETCWSG